MSTGLTPRLAAAEVGSMPPPMHLGAIPGRSNSLAVNTAVPPKTPPELALAMRASSKSPRVVEDSVMLPRLRAKAPRLEATTDAASAATFVALMSPATELAAALQTSPWVTSTSPTASTPATQPTPSDDADVDDEADDEEESLLRLASLRGGVMARRATRQPARAQPSQAQSKQPPTFSSPPVLPPQEGWDQVPGRRSDRRAAQPAPDGDSAAVEPSAATDAPSEPSKSDHVEETDSQPAASAATAAGSDGEGDFQAEWTSAKDGSRRVRGKHGNNAKQARRRGYAIDARAQQRAGAH